jgi:2-oxoglutarate ferredoxin oxidoreductase subunit alpha
MEKRMGKLQDIDKENKGFEGFGNFGGVGEIGRKLIVGWGSTKEIILSFLKDHSDYNYLHFWRPWPFPKEAVEILKKAERIVVIEGNYSGQLADLIERFTFRKVERILKDDGRPFYKKELELKLLK